jgi:DNA helicase II / ATP-dependent DNA helicase PcrA
MRFYADLHVHSKYSRATSSDCDLAHLSAWARRKGIAVIGTGDFTHPAWRAELRENLVEAEPGLYRLRDPLERAVAAEVEPPCRAPTRFMLSVEIATIYKKGPRTRKIHHLVYVPDFASADRLVKALSRIGNLNADGRPILGLDSRDLLEEVLSSGEGSYLVPAHIWTPWFSVLGSKAGFDAVEECYGDLAPHIFALETGLSSDPPMNWRISALDRYRLVSSSDAHSPPKLGREASIFDGPLDYFAMRRALETGAGFGGTLEFFPEEGKYHLDGHRACGVRLSPEETKACGEVCPVCKRGLTVGVLHRVAELADRAEGARPEGAGGFENLLPLPEVLGELCGVGAASKVVQRSYAGLLARLGPELFILAEAEVEAIDRVGPPLLAEAVLRMRRGQVIRDAGYDGEYGTIRLFTKDELSRRLVVAPLFAEAPREEAGARAATSAALPAPGRGPSITEGATAEAASAEAPAEGAPTTGVLATLDPDQRAAASITEGALLILAGPGTGKTRTLTHRIAHLVAERGVSPSACLAVTFTRRAADEMRERLRALLGEDGDRVPTLTFHALGLSILREFHVDPAAAGGEPPRAFAVADERERTRLLVDRLGVNERKAESLLSAIGRFKQAGIDRAAARALPEGMLVEGSLVDRAFAAYEEGLAAGARWDFDDLVTLAVRLLDARPDVLAELRLRYRYVAIDEYQDIDERQYQLARLLVGGDTGAGNLCAIGDPDQAIYGFRGADVGFFLRFREAFPEARVARLTRNYRSTSAIVEAALAVIAPAPTLGERRLVARAAGGGRVALGEGATARGEADLVAQTIERMMGGASFFALDSGRITAATAGGDHAFSDFAVLYRSEAQSHALAEALARSGMPFQRRSHRRLGERAAVTALAEALCASRPSRPLDARLREAAARLREEVARASPPSPLLPGEAAARGLPRAGEDSQGEAREAIEEADVDAALELLAPLAARSDHDLAQFLSELSISAEVDAWDPRADRITLLTLHASKGLEFRVVILVGCEDGILPLRFGGDEDEAALIEERRLFYVGMTRARERLFFTWARERRRGGEVARTELSPFVRAIPAPLLERAEPLLARAKLSPARRQLKLF